MKNILAFLILINLFGCNYFENKKVDPQDIVDEEMESINWNEVDEYPAFEFCDSLEGKFEKRDCFQTYLSKRVSEFLGEQQFVVSKDINEIAQMTITVNSSAQLTVDSVKIGEVLHQELPELDSLLFRSLDSLPAIYPAIKRGQHVKVRFNLPIEILVE